jgi:hypothetical protein
MKTFRTVVALGLCTMLLTTATSCIVLTRHDNGKHKGWYKNSHNPHHPKSTNPGKAKKN